jgi:hypothetical protein
MEHTVYVLNDPDRNGNPVGLWGPPRSKKRCIRISVADTLEPYKKLWVIMAPSRKTNRNRVVYVSETHPADRIRDGNTVVEIKIKTSHSPEAVKRGKEELEKLGVEATNKVLLSYNHLRDQAERYRSMALELDRLRASLSADSDRFFVDTGRRLPEINDMLGLTPTPVIESKKDWADMEEL